MIQRFSPVAVLAALERQAVCARCARKLVGSIPPPKRLYFQSSRLHQIAAIKADGLDKSFFWANALRKRREEIRDTSRGVTQLAASSDAASIRSTAQPAALTVENGSATSTEPPHRRRKRLKAAAASVDVTEAPLPPDASSNLSRAAEAAPAKSLKRSISTYLALSKPRLAFLVMLTATASYSIYPVPSLLSTSATAAPSLNTLTLLYLTSGTFFTIASANTLNMLFEPVYDAKMSRTRNRPLVRGLVSKRAALVFAVATGIVGTAVLWYGVNPTTSVLGAGNLALYAFAYTPLKRMHPVNTWVGAVVGAVPPLMGWCAAASQYSTMDSTTTSLWEESRELLFTEQAVGGWLIAALLFAWQFPHFFALSHGVRHEYANAGYKMLTSTNTAMAARVSFRYSLAMFPICAGLSFYGVTDPSFFVTSSVVNAWMLRDALKFLRLRGDAGSARALFWASVWQLPLVLVLAMVQKKGLWERLWRSVMGEPEAEELWAEEDEVED